MKKERNIALIMAGGSGDRMGTDTPKQFVCLGGVPVILYTLKAFQKHPEIDEIGVVCVPGWEDFVRELSQKHGIDKLKHIFVGKKSSHESVRAGMEGLCEVCDMKDIVLVHDAVRPFISAQIITDNIEVCRTKGNAITAVLDNEALMYSTDGVASEKYCHFKGLQMVTVLLWLTREKYMVELWNTVILWKTLCLLQEGFFLLID